MASLLLLYIDRKAISDKYRFVRFDARVCIMPKKIIITRPLYISYLLYGYISFVIL